MKKIIFIISVLMLQGCATVDIRPVAVRLEGMNPEMSAKGIRLLQQAVWQNDKTSAWERFDEWQITATDVWKANIVRRLTPIEQSEQKVLFTFRIDGSDTAMEYLEGKSKGEVIGIDEKEAYRIDNGEKVYKPDNKTRLYLAPVRDYFFWPHTLVNAKVITYAGEADLNNKEYHKVFATNGTFDVTSTEDQFVVWIDKTSLDVEYIEFTLRDLFKSYRGVAAYSDYREIDGMRIPHRITLPDKIGKEKYSHEFIIEKMEFKNDPSDVSLTINIKELKEGIF